MRSLGDVFVEFVTPLIAADEPSEPENIPGLLAAALEIWNAGCRDAVEPGTDHMRLVRERLESVATVPFVCVEMLIRRRRELYGDDHRLVIDVALGHDDGGIPVIIVEEAALPADFSDDDFPGSETDGATVDITRALMEYAIPFIPPDADEHGLRTAMGVAIEIWNARVTDSMQGGDEHVGGVRRRCISNRWPPRDIVEAMIRRKDRHFGADLRLVDHFGVRSDDMGQAVFHCGARGDRQSGDR